MISGPNPVIEIAQALLSKRRAAAEAARLSVENLTSSLGPKQRAFFSSAAPRIVLDGSRQCGKSHGIAARLIDVSTSSKCQSMYVAPTSKNARKAVWQKFYELNDVHKLGIEMREAAFEARFPNGSVVGFEGAHDMARVRRLRGATISGILCVDESAFFPDALIRELLGPTLSSMFLTTRQRIVVASSPGLQRRGKMFELLSDPAWEHHHLTVDDNPIIKDPATALAELRAANAWTEQTPSYQREGLGLWVDDATHNVYELGEHNLIDVLPVGDWTTILLVDFGKNDQSALAIAGWLPYDPALYILHVEGASNLDIEDVSQRALALIEEHKPIGTFGDSGGGGAQHMDYMRKRHSINIKPVSKRPNYKAPAIRDLNADMRRGLYKVLRTAPVVEQMRDLQWDPTALSRGEFTEHPDMPNDLCDVAGVYAFVQARHYRPDAPPSAPPAYGTAEHLKRTADEGLAHAIAEANRVLAEREAQDEDVAILLGDDL